MSRQKSAAAIVASRKRSEGPNVKHGSRKADLDVNSRVQVTTDGHKAYLEADEGAFGMDVDYAQLQKIYGAPSDAEIRRQVPPSVSVLK